jgi:hypothetical protein
MNVLKINNRFSSLLENNKPSQNYDTRQHKNVSRSDYNKYKHDSKNVIKKVQVPININMNDFPALIESQVNNAICNVTNNYVEKVLLQQPITVLYKVEQLPYGWIRLPPNIHNKNTIPQEPSMENAFVTLYNKRKEAYIDLWGDEEYEKMFAFPNHEPEHDYIYFAEEDDDNEDEDSSVDEYYEYDDDDYYN